MLHATFKTALLTATLMIAPAALAEDEAPTRNDILVLPSSHSGDAQEIVNIGRERIEGLRRRNKLLALSGADSALLGDVQIGDRRSDNIPSYVQTRYRAELAPIITHLRELRESAPVAPEMMRLDIPELVSVIGNLRGDDDAPAQALIIGSPLSLFGHDPSASMIAGDGTVRIPTDGALVAGAGIHPLGYDGNAKALNGVSLHFCASDLDIEPFQEAATARMWGHYIALRGGALVTFTSDLDLCARRFRQRLTSPMELTPLDRDSAIGMIEFTRNGELEVFTVDQREDLNEQLAQERREAAERIRQLIAAKEVGDQTIGGLEDRIGALEGEIVINGERYEATLEELEVLQEVLAHDDDEFETVTSFSRFQDVPHASNRDITVVTGVSYLRDELPRYEESWCYFASRTPDKISVRLDIGKKARGGSIRWERPNQNALDSVRLTTDDFLNARASCRFPVDQ